MPTLTAESDTVRVLTTQSVLARSHPCRRGSKRRSEPGGRRRAICDGLRRTRERPSAVSVARAWTKTARPHESSTKRMSTESAAPESPARLCGRGPRTGSGKSPRSKTLDRCPYGLRELLVRGMRGAVEAWNMPDTPAMKQARLRSSDRGWARRRGLGVGFGRPQTAWVQVGMRAPLVAGCAACHVDQCPETSAHRERADTYVTLFTVGGDASIRRRYRARRSSCRNYRRATAAKASSGVSMNGSWPTPARIRTCACGNPSSSI